MTKQQYIEFEFTTDKIIPEIYREFFWEKYNRKSEEYWNYIRTGIYHKMPEDLMQKSLFTTKIKVTEILGIQRMYHGIKPEDLDEKYFALKSTIHVSKEDNHPKRLIVPIKYWDQINNLLI